MILVREILKNYYQNDATVRVDIDVAITKLKTSNSLTVRDLEIIEMVKSQYSLQDMAAHYNVNKTTVNKRVGIICRRLCEVLGDGYDDASIFSHVKVALRRELTDKEKEFCISIIQSLGFRKSIANNIFSMVDKDDTK
jgi:hypothetical protein